MRCRVPFIYQVKHQLYYRVRNIHLVIGALVANMVVIFLHAEEAEERRVLRDDLPRLVPGRVVLPPTRVDRDRVEHL